ncbi:hypothetical protein BDN70DRAFT_995797 [Pholiota conissans]|uniref:F-box domain-containing protein n=1 Tax=Pholiota conissans TaxID=109636 RepID=A0A9P6CX45_9AGAR|nr:hypothetical protein BDN70DRAFT_995797 [Pholiota conissans]
MDLSFLRLPTELKIEILSNLDAISLIRSAMVCKDLHKTCLSSSLLAYTTQLHLNGLKDAGTGAPYPHLLQELLCYRRTWMSVNSITFQWLLSNNSRTHDLVGGVYANKTMDGIEIVPISTNPTDAAQNRIVRGLGGIVVAQLGVDPMQDLLVLLEGGGPRTPQNDGRFMRVHVHSMADGGCHPRALHSPLQLPIPRSRSEMIEFNIHNALCIAGDIVAICFDVIWSGTLTKTRAIIWDWTTSELIMDSVIAFYGSLLPTRFGFGLLDSLSFYVTSTQESGSIRFYKLVGSRRSAIHIATFHLPSVVRDAGVINISSSAGPIEVSAIPGASFMVNDDDRLHAFTLDYTSYPYPGSTSLSLFVHQHVFTSFFPEHVSPNHQPLEIKWERWGPANTAFIHPHAIPFEDSSRSYIHGQRVVCQGKSVVSAYSNIRASKSFRLLDFSLAAVVAVSGALRSTPTASPLPSSSSSYRSTWALFSSRKIEASQVPIFREDVETRLPFVSCTRDVGAEGTFRGYMIHVDGIVGYKV